LKQQRHHTPSPTHPRPPRGLGLLVVLVLLTLLVAADHAWAGWLAAPVRQTVPMTPPPTWTPVAQATPLPPRPRPTQPPPEATPVPQAQPWLWLTADPHIAAPGNTVTVRLEVRNIGGSTMDDAIATLDIPDIPPWLRVISYEVSAGSIGMGTERLEWRLGALGAGAEAVCVLTGSIALDAPPGRDIELLAEFGAPASGVIQDRAIVSLPWALLPEAGGP
jgi:hypothetical protein